MYLGLVELTFGLVYASFRLPEWLALKMTFFPPCIVIEKFRMCQYLYGYNQNNVQMMMMMMMMMMAGQIKLILKTIRFTCTKSQHYDSPNFFLFVHHKWCPGQKLVCPFYKENYLQICSDG